MANRLAPKTPLRGDAIAARFHRSAAGEPTADTIIASSQVETECPI